MSSLWPWLAVAGAGALHGLNPTTGWMFAAAWSVRSHDSTQSWRALLPIALGHVAAVALVALAVVLGVAVYHVVLPTLIGSALAILLIGAHSRVTKRRRTATSAAHAGLALWSFMMSTVHGTGWMLVPAFVPLCMGSTPAREMTASGSLLLALAIVAVHMAAMLAVTGVTAFLACRTAGITTRAA